MAERSIEHPLRTIRLVQDDHRPETEADRLLLQRYMALHDALLTVRREAARLRYEFLEFEAEVEHVQQLFAPHLDLMDALVHESEVLIGKVRREEAVYELVDRMNEAMEPIGLLHNNQLVPLGERMDTLNAERDAFFDASEACTDAFVAYDEEIEQPFYADCDAYAIDLVRYADDMEELKGMFDRVDDQADVDRVVHAYDAFINRVNDTYGRWTLANTAINAFFDSDDLLNRRISEACAKGELPKEQQPIYLIDPTDPRIDDFAGTYGMLADPANATLLISVPKEAVDHGEGTMIPELVLGLQHFPALMAKMLWSIDISIANEFGGEMDEEDWKGHEVPVRWIRSFSALPCIYFFLKDHDVRHYFLMGDLVFDGIVHPSADGEHVKVEGEALQTLAQRVFDMCTFFMLFCHNTGFDPSDTIQQVLLDLEMPFTLDDVRSEYQEQIARGVDIKAVKVRKDQ